MIIIRFSLQIVSQDTVSSTNQDAEESYAIDLSSRNLLFPRTQTENDEIEEGSLSTSMMHPLKQDYGILFSF